MLKRIFWTMAIAAAVGLAGHAWRSDAMPGDPGTSIADPERLGTALASAPPPRRAATCEAAAPPDAAEACMTEAALTTDEAERAQFLRRAASAWRDDDGATADSLLLMAAARGDLRSLADFADGEDGAPEGRLVRREAALMANEGGSDQARITLERLRAGYRAQALSRPDVLATLLEGRGLDLGDDMETRRYLLGLAAGFQQSCPFQAPMWDSAGFARAKELYSAPVEALSHTQIASSALDALTRASGAIGRFAQRMEQGAGYVDAGSGLLRDLREAQRDYNSSVSRVGEAGARDGVRSAELLAGCSSADGARFTRALLDVFSARARQAPGRV